MAPPQTTNNETNLVSRQLIVLGVIALVVFAWSYWPILTNLVGEWMRVADYTHGFVVVPVAIYFLWMVKDSFPGVTGKISWMGLSLILAAGLIRVAGAHYYIVALQGLSIPVWIAGCVWTLCGWKALKWSLPAIAFLVFMVPIPYSVEHLLSQPLQKISTKMSLFGLQSLLQPALAEGTTILLGKNVLEIERACSGLRIFFGITALAYGFMLMYRRSLWTKLGLVLAILPITLLSNSFRIILTGLLFQMGLGDIANHISHDFAGIVMVLVAAFLFWLTLQYLDRLFLTVSSVDLGKIARGNL